MRYIDKALEKPIKGSRFKIMLQNRCFGAEPAFHVQPVFFKRLLIHNVAAGLDHNGRK